MIYALYSKSSEVKQYRLFEEQTFKWAEITLEK